MCPARMRLLARNDLANEAEFSWAYSPKVVRTNEIVRSVIIMLYFPYNNFFYLYSSIRTFFEQVYRKTLLGDTVPKCALVQEI